VKNKQFNAEIAEIAEGLFSSQFDRQFIRVVDLPERFEDTGRITPTAREPSDPSMFQ
jgi:hypothetical protein